MRTAFTKNVFQQIKGIHGLVVYFNLDFEKTVKCLKGLNATPEYYYHIVEIPKKSGGARRLEIPDNSLRDIQRQLKKKLDQRYRKEEIHAAQGFIQNRSIVSNAAYHKNKALLVKIDLKDFFPNIAAKRIFGLFCKVFGADLEAAKKFTALVTFNNHLPQGAPTSPILSNMVCLQLDHQLRKFAKENHATYTRYADDITFSCGRKAMPKLVDSTTKKMNQKIPQIIEKCGFTINDEKTKIISNTYRQKVTGLIVNKKVNVPRFYIRQLRAMIHSAETGKTKLSKEIRQQIQGKIAYLKMVRSYENKNDLLYAKYAHRFNITFGMTFPEAEFILDLPHAMKNAAIVFDFSQRSEEGTEQSYSGTGFFINNYLVTAGHNIDGVSLLHYYTYDALSESLFPKENLFTLDDKLLKKVKDVALHKTKSDDMKGKRLKLSPGRETDYLSGAEVLVCGYHDFINPQVTKDPVIVKARISGRRKYCDEEGYSIDMNFYAGMSGSFVLNDHYEVIGVVICGTNSEHEYTASTPISIFQPINKQILEI